MKKVRFRELSNLAEVTETPKLAVVFFFFFIPKGGVYLKLFLWVRELLSRWLMVRAKMEITLDCLKRALSFGKDTIFTDKSFREFFNFASLQTWRVSYQFVILSFKSTFHSQLFSNRDRPCVLVC